MYFANNGVNVAIKKMLYTFVVIVGYTMITIYRILAHII